MKVTHCPQGHTYSGNNLYINPKGWRFCVECRRVGLRKLYRDKRRAAGFDVGTTRWPLSAEERFQGKYRVNLASGCWLWTAGLNHKSYGMFSYHSLNMPAHRFSYELYKGPIPSQMQIDHTCHNNTDCVGGNTCIHRRCVNPDHLELVTARINILRGRGIAARCGIVTQCPSGHPYSGDNLYTNPSGSRICRICTDISRKKWKRKTLLLKEATEHGFEV